MLAACHFDAEPAQCQRRRGMPWPRLKISA
jgi:hypothetical protein